MSHHNTATRTNINTWLTFTVLIIAIIGFVGPWYVFPERLSNNQTATSLLATRVTALEVKSESSGNSLARLEEQLRAVSDRTERIETLLLSGIPRRTYSRQTQSTP